MLSLRALPTFLNNKLSEEYHSIALWYVVSFCAGIISFFALSSAPSIYYTVTALVVSLSFLFFQKHSILSKFITWIIIAFIFGSLVAQYRTVSNKVVTIDKTVTSKVMGTVESIKPSSRGMYVILRDVHIKKGNQKLGKVRINIPTKYSENLRVEDYIQVFARVGEPKSNILPGSYNFKFYAHLQEIGATGYSLSAPIILKRHESNTGVMSRVQSVIYQTLSNALERDQANFIAAILLGESKGISKQLLDNIRVVGISHILCVSGLHLSLVAMICFFTVRIALNLFDFVALRLNIKVISGIFALFGSYFYLLLSGVQIAATRAFIMTALFIIAIIIERSPSPLRSVVIAAFCILCIHPEYLFHPSFQLSFIAVISLIAGYELYKSNQWILGEKGGIFSTLKFYFASNIYSSFLASIVTAPVIISQFYTFSTYSILMNLIAVPLMSFVLMPLALIALVLIPFNMGDGVLNVMGIAISYLIDITNMVSKWPLSVLYCGYITPLTLILFVFGFFWICFWQTSWRIFGLIPILLSCILYFNIPKPNFMVHTNLGMIGVQNPDGKLEIYTSKRKVSFYMQYWARWFGQEGAQNLPLDKQIYTSINNYTLAWNIGEIECTSADVQINIDKDCPAKKLSINLKDFEGQETLLIFCSKDSCSAK